MAITLPDFTALPDVTPRAVGGVPSLPAEDPGAAGLAVLGKGVSAAAGAITDIAAYRDVRRTKMDEAMAGADFTNRVIPLTEQLKVETDPEKITALRGQYAQALQASSNAIGNPEARALWLLKNQSHVAQGEADVDLRNTVVYRDRWKAGAAQTLEDLARTGATATDPQAYDGNRLRIDQVTEEAAKSGAMTAAEAQAHNNKAKIEMAAGRIDTLMARGQFDEASALLQQNRADLGPVAAAGFEARIEQKAEKAGIKSDISDAYYGAAGRPGGRVSLGPAGPGFDDLWGRVKGAEGGVGRAGEAKVSPKGAIGVSQILKETARGVADRMGVPYDEKRLYTDQAYNESLGRRYLQEMLDRYGGNRVLATAAYNAGPGRVDEWIGKYGDPRTGEVSDAQFAAQIPFSETRQYVRSVGAISAPPVGAAAAPGATPGATPGRAAFDLSAGDSIGLSAIKNGGLPGTYADDATKPVFDAARKPVGGRESGNAQSVGGRSPQGNLDYINAHPEEFQGKTVFWSTGLMNAGRTAAEARKALPIVEQQLDRLKELGANVVVAGVDKGRYAPLNSELEALASARQLPFAGALPTTDVHPGPQQMKAYVANAQQLLPSGGAAAAPGAAGPQLGDFSARPPAGQLEPGNIDLNARPVVRNPDGTISTVRTIGIEENGKQVNIPTVAADGSRILSNDEAIKQYKDTGQHLGKFDTVENANAAAEQLHQAQAAQYAGSGGSTPPAAAPGAAPAAGPLAPHVDIDGITARIQARADSGEITQTRADAIIAGVRHLYNNDQAKEAITRSALETRLKNGMAALQDGQDFDYDPTAIRHYFPADKAAAFIAGLDDSKTAGQYTNSLKNASPTEAFAQRAALVADMKDPNATDYPRRKALLAHFDAVSEKLSTQLDKDPAAYVVAANPTVNQAYKDYLLAAQQPPAATATSPQEAARQHARAFADYAQASLAAQAHMGVPEEKRAVLATGQAADLAAKISAIDPTKQSPVAEMRKLAAGYGAGQGTNDYWPQVFGELVKHKLPGPYQLLASMDRPDQAVAAGDLSIALGIVAQKGGMHAIKEASTAEAQKGLEQALETELADFRGSTAPQGVGGAKLYDTVKDGARAMALYYGYRGESQNAAVQHAVDGIIRNKYDFGSLGPTQVRVPKGTFRDVSVAADILKADVTPDELGPVPLRDPALAKVLSPVEAKELWMSAIRNGGWANNRDDSGLVLMGKFRDGGEYPVLRSDGTQIVLKFDNVPAFVGALPPPTQLSPEDIGVRPGVR